MKHLVAAFGPTPLGKITRADVECYQQQRQHDKVRPATINRERSVLSHLFTKAKSWNLVQTNPVLGTDRLREGNEHPRPISVEEAARWTHFLF